MIKYSDEISDCKTSWTSMRNGYFCKIHGKQFKFGENCPRLPIISDGDISKIEKVMSSEFHEQLRVNHEQLQAVKIKPITRKYVRKVKDSVYERFHNYGVKFVAEVQWEHLFNYPEFKLNNNVFFKRIDFDTAIVKVFKKSILITLRSSQEIKGFLVKEAEAKSILLINEVLNRLPKAIVVRDRSVVNTHNAFVNHITAKLFKEMFGREMVVRDEEGVIHIQTDNSKHNHELEYVNKDTAISGSEYRESYEYDIFHNKPDYPSKTQNRVDGLESNFNIILAVQRDYAENIKKHLAVQDKTLDTMSSMDKTLKIMRREFNKKHSKKKSSRLDKVKKLKDEWW